MSGRTRWGIVGTGGISRATGGDLHLAEDLDRVAVASRHEQTAAAFAAAHEVPRWYGDVDALLAADDVDVVYLCTPIGTHADLARRALLAGKHVLVEKAFTSTADEARSLAALAAEQGRELVVAMWMRFNPAVRRVLHEVADGRIGEVRSVRASFGFPPPPGTAHWQPGGGGALLDMGVYPLTLAHLLLGVPTAVEATGEVRADGVDLTASVFLRHGDDRFAALLTSLRSFVGAGADIGRTGRSPWTHRSSPRARSACCLRRPGVPTASSCRWRATGTCRCSARSPRPSPTDCWSTPTGRCGTRSPSWTPSTWCAPGCSPRLRSDGRRPPARPGRRRRPAGPACRPRPRPGRRRA